MLEANLVLHKGVSLPLVSEFLSYAEDDPDDHKQDGELKAFSRLAARLKAYFPCLPVLLLLDGLYPNGPLMALCRQYGWQFMIVLPAKWLPSVWEEVEALKPRLPHHRKHQHWHGCQQPFCWVNDITSSYEGDRKSLLVHGVGCEETWPEVDPESGELIAKQTQYVWLSSQRLDSYNVHERCNLGARQRWGIETSLLVEKCLALATKRVASQVRTLGVPAFLRWVRESCAHRWLRWEWIERFRATPLQLRLE